MIKLILRCVKFLVGLTVILSWSVIGFVLWLPLLARMTAYFTGIVTAASFRKIDLSNAKESLNFAIEFYINGFRRIIATLSNNSIDPASLPALKNEKPASLLDFLKSIAVDIVWAIIFWGFIGIKVL